MIIEPLPRVQRSPFPHPQGPHLSALIEVLDLLIPARRSEIDLARPRFPSDPSLTAELVDRGWLTPLQRRWVLRGHGEKLLVGSYILLERVGEGGMGQVYLARHRALGRLAAIKLLRTERRDDHRSKRRFVREVRALGRLNHPNVVFAYDAGDAGRSLYLAMEYVPGPDLAQTLAAGGRLPPGLACEYARQAALGLQHMHERGLVHRDIKPSNLSLADGGRLLKVLDVGLVRDRERAVADAGLTRVGFLVGTPDYTAPEQVLDARRAGQRSANTRSDARCTN